MKSFHVNKGWGDIAQHITSCPDGTILLGRGFSKRPASISGRNTGAFCLEQIGDFDLGKDIITVAQRNNLLRLIQYFRKRGTRIVFHREYSSKTCPGTSLHKQGLIDASDYYFRTGELRKWITGADVAEVQKKLGVKADGSFGPATETAIKKYQEQHGLKADGIVGADTFASLGMTGGTITANKPAKGTPIMGKAETTAQQMVAFVLKENPSPKVMTSIENIAKLFLREGEIEGVRGDVAFAQAIKETGYFRFGGDVVPDQNNYAGIGTTGGGVKGHYFKTPQIGVQAQIQHLKAYASAAPLVQACVDPRFKLVARGIAPNVEDLNGKWAVPGKGYGESILAILEKIKAIDVGAIAPEESEEVETVEEKDVDLVPNWAKEEWAEAIKAGITDGTRPGDTATRAEVAAMILRATKGEKGERNEHSLDGSNVRISTGL